MLVESAPVVYFSNLELNKIATTIATLITGRWSYHSAPINCSTHHASSMDIFAVQNNYTFVRNELGNKFVIFSPEATEERSATISRRQHFAPPCHENIQVVELTIALLKGIIYHKAGKAPKANYTKGPLVSS